MTQVRGNMLTASDAATAIGQTLMKTRRPYSSVVTKFDECCYISWKQMRRG